jgi:hypothetical protein
MVHHWTLDVKVETPFSISSTRWTIGMPDVFGFVHKGYGRAIRQGALGSGGCGIQMLLFLV